MKRLLAAHEAFYADRPAMDKSNDLAFLIKAVMEEAQELQEEPTDGMSREKYIEQEAVDVILYGLAILRKLCVDPEEAIMEKLARNMCRYEARYFQNGSSFEESVKLCKKNFGKRENREFYR